MREEIKQKILEYLKKQKEKNKPTTFKELEEKLNFSKPTISKYLLVLEAENKIEVSDYGNIKFYYLKNG